MARSTTWPLPLRRFSWSAVTARNAPIRPVVESASPKPGSSGGRSGIDRGEHVVARAPFLQGAGPVVLAQDIGILDQPLDDLHAQRRVQIGRDPLLPAIDDLVVEPDPGL